MLPVGNSIYNNRSMNLTGISSAKDAEVKPPNNAIMEDLGARMLERLLQHGQFEWEKQSIERQIQYYDNADPTYAAKLREYSVDELAAQNVLQREAQAKLIDQQRQQQAAEQNKKVEVSDPINE
jgi:hypothetical protein